MMIIKRFFKLLAVLLFLNQSVFAQLSINQIIDKNLELTGLNPEKGMISNFMISGSLIQNQFDLPIEMYGILPDYQRMNMLFNGIAFIKASDGKTNWELNPMKDTLIVKEGKPNEATNFYSRWTGGLSEFKDGKITGEFIGTDTIEDVEVYKLKMQKNNNVRIYYIDKLSYLLLRVDDEDPNVQKSTYYSDYKKVGGFLLAHKLSGFEFGKLVMTMVFKTVKVNTTIDKEMFKLPNKE